jgi:hypothetical protein
MTDTNLDKIEIDGIEYKHGDKLQCPQCGTWGRLDIGDDPKACFSDSIWKSFSDGHWECIDCWLK